MNRIPEAGKAISVFDVEEIVDAMTTRNRNFPEEPGAMTMTLVLMNIGDRYTPVACQGGEWSGIKRDIPKRDDGGIPLCPNGHVMTEERGITLGWIPTPDGS